MELYNRVRPQRRQRVKIRSEETEETVGGMEMDININDNDNNWGHDQRLHHNCPGEMRCDCQGCPHYCPNSKDWRKSKCHPCDNYDHHHHHSEQEETNENGSNDSSRIPATPITTTTLQETWRNDEVSPPDQPRTRTRRRARIKLCSILDMRWSSGRISTMSSRILLYTFAMFLISISHLPVSYACSSRSTPKPRPPSPTLRPNITIQTYTCPQEYDAHYCLNGATCFTVKIGESILYNCECAEGYMGQRCEFKDLDGSYLPSKQRAMLEQAGVSGAVAIVIVLVVIFSGYLYVWKSKKNKMERLAREGRDQVDAFVIERRPFSQMYYYNPSISLSHQHIPHQSQRGSHFQSQPQPQPSTSTSAGVTLGVGYHHHPTKPLKSFQMPSSEPGPSSPSASAKPLEGLVAQPSLHTSKKSKPPDPPLRQQ